MLAGFHHQISATKTDNLLSYKTCNKALLLKQAGILYLHPHSKKTKVMKAQKMKTNILVFSLITAALLSVFTGCLKSSDSPPPTPTTTFLSVMHMAPNAPAVDVYFNETKVSTGALPVLSTTNRYNEVDKGTFSIKFKKAASDSLVAEIASALYDTLEYHTLLIYNLVTNGPAKAIRIKDDFSNVFANLAKPYYRFFHTSPNTGAVDLYINNVKVETGRFFADNASHDPFNKFTGTTSDYLKIEVKPTGSNTAIATLNNVYMQNGNAYTIYLKGLDGGTGNNQLSLGVLMASN